jgi:hypothetical protein
MACRVVNDFGYVRPQAPPGNMSVAESAAGGDKTMKWKWDRIISVATLVTSLLALCLVLKKPAPVAQPQAPAAASANAQSFQAKIEELEKPKEPGQPPAEVRLNADEVSAAIAQAVATVPASSGQAAPGVPTSTPSSPDAMLGAGQPEIKDYQVSFEGDVAHGQFLTQIAGKDVWVTLAGHLGSKDGYATFDPTEFKVGDLNVPVSLVNDSLQKRLAEQRDRMKLPDNVGGIKVENGELVMTQR